MKRRIILAALSCLLVVKVSQAQINDSTNWTVENFPAFGFSISRPANWNVIQRPTTSLPVFRATKTFSEDRPNDQLSCRVDILNVERTKNSTQDELDAAIRRNNAPSNETIESKLRTGMPDARVFNAGKYEFNGHPFITYEMATVLNTANVKLNSYRLVAATNSPGRQYTITCTCFTEADELERAHSLFQLSSESILRFIRSFSLASP
jgi:hypothetical protein